MDTSSIKNEVEVNNAKALDEKIISNEDDTIPLTTTNAHLKDLEHLAQDKTTTEEVKKPVSTRILPSRILRTILIITSLWFILNMQTTNTYVTAGEEWAPTLDGHKPIINGFGEGSVHILQVANKEYFTNKSPHIMNRTAMVETNKRWANCNNYTHTLKIIPKSAEDNMYTAKVNAILDTLTTIKQDDWIIFLDGDVQIQSKDVCDRTLEKIIPLQSDDNVPCQFMAMTGSSTINTGVMLIKSTNSTKTLVQQWLNEQSKPNDHELTYGAADQLSLQEVILQHTLPKSIYTKHKCSTGVQSARNYCFRDTLPIEYRSTKNICLISCHDKHPLQCADCEHSCSRSKAIFLHDNKKERANINIGW